MSFSSFPPFQIANKSGVWMCVCLLSRVTIANRFANTSAGANNAAKMSNNPEFIPFAHSSQQQQHARM